MRVLPYTILAACILLGGSTQVLFKMGMNSIGPLEKLLSLKTVTMILSNKYIIIGLVLYGVSSVLWLIGLSMLDVSLMYPLLSLAYVVTTVLAFMILNEPVRTTRWIGVLLIILGSILVGVNR
ncbi:EamA family transporter [Palaeococcus sp. (in: euryarchaeotes)]